MAENRSQTQAKRPPILVFVLLFAIPAAGFFVYNQNRQINGEDKTMGVKSSHDLSAQMEQVKTIRDKWQVWAMAHKADLLAFKHSAPDDKAAFDKVFDAVPITISPDTGLTLEDLKAATADDPTHKHTKWDWLMKQKPLLNASGMQASMSKQEAEIFKANVEEDRTKNKDIRVLKSTNGGLSNLYLWTSGRVTEGVRERKSVGGEKTGSIMVLSGVVTHKEAMPAYDFLK